MTADARPALDVAVPLADVDRFLDALRRDVVAHDLDPTATAERIQAVRFRLASLRVEAVAEQITRLAAQSGQGGPE